MLITFNFHLRTCKLNRQNNMLIKIDHTIFEKKFQFRIGCKGTIYSAACNRSRSGTEESHRKWFVLLNSWTDSEWWTQNNFRQTKLWLHMVPMTKWRAWFLLKSYSSGFISGSLEKQNQKLGKNAILAQFSFIFIVWTRCIWICKKKFKTKKIPLKAITS